MCQDNRPNFTKALLELSGFQEGFSVYGMRTVSQLSAAPDDGAVIGGFGRMCG